MCCFFKNDNIDECCVWCDSTGGLGCIATVRELSLKWVYVVGSCELGTDEFNPVLSFFFSLGNFYIDLLAFSGEGEEFRSKHLPI